MKMEIPQELYAKMTLATRAHMAKALQDPETARIIKRAYPLTKGGEIHPDKWSMKDDRVVDAGRAYMKAMYASMQKAGVTTSLGFNFYDLRGPAYFIFPFLTPLLQEIGREGKVNAGTGTMANWKATRNPNNTGIYAGLAEGTRNQIATPDEVNYYASYKELGMEGGVTFTAQFAGEGYTDNQADEHFRNLVRLRLQEEMILLCGNAGPTTNNSVSTGNLGFALGKPTTPTNTAAALTGGLAANSNVFVCCVPITAMGMAAGGQAGYGAAPSVAGGLTMPYTRTNSDATTLNVNTGLGIISNITSVVTCTSAFSVNSSTTAVKGAVGYAWFWGVNVTSAYGNLNLGAITSAPWVSITAVATGTQLANVAGANGSVLTADNSYQTTDFDGLVTYTINNGTVTDMGGGSFTPTAQGEIAEIETDLQNMWTKYQAQPTTIFVSSDVRTAFDAAATYTGSGQSGYMFVTPRAVQDSGLLAGFIVSGYKSKYSLNSSGGTEIPIRIHPMLPPGTMFYDISDNPYPHSKIPGVRMLLMQRDYYAVEWPVVARIWTFGTYVHEVLAHYIPWITAMRTGVGKFVAPSCHLAALAFGEDFFTGPRTAKVRNYLYGTVAKKGIVARTVLALYSAFGERAAKTVAKSNLLKRGVRALFTRVLARAEAAEAQA